MSGSYIQFSCRDSPEMQQVTVHFDESNKLGSASSTNAAADGTAGWMHSVLTKDSSKALVMESGGVDGTYLVWTKAEGSQYVLTVVHKNNPTHHLMAKNADGYWAVSKKDYGLRKTELKDFVR
jgi:hypothetical protein